MLPSRRKLLGSTFAHNLIVVVNVFDVAGFIWLILYSITRRRRIREYRERVRLSEANWWKSHERAKELLKHLIGEKAHNKFLVTGWIEVPSKLYPGCTYLIAPNGGGVHVKQEGYSQLIAHLCVFVPTPFPDDDGTATIYLMAKHQEKMLIEHSKVSGYLPR